MSSRLLKELSTLNKQCSTDIASLPLFYVSDDLHHLLFYFMELIKMINKRQIIMEHLILQSQNSEEN